MEYQIPAEVMDCLDVLAHGGHAAYLVGGCVRDMLLGRTPYDFDIATSAQPEEVISLFPKTIPTGIAHGTVTVMTEGDAIEVTTFRREGDYGDGRHPDGVSFDATLEEDLARRDFTINAMAMDRSGTIIDLWGGQEDLKKGVIRCVGDPNLRFSEDGLRLLRGVRFAAQLGFMLEEETERALKKNAHRTQRVARERIRIELEKILLSTKPEVIGEVFALRLVNHLHSMEEIPDLTVLRDVPPTPEERWRALCNCTQFPIDCLPVERSLKRAVLHPELAVIKKLALTGGDLMTLGLQGQEISQVQKKLACHVLKYPEDNRQEVLLRLLKTATTP